MPSVPGLPVRSGALRGLHGHHRRCRLDRHGHGLGLRTDDAFLGPIGHPGKVILIVTLIPIRIIGTIGRSRFLVAFEHRDEVLESAVERHSRIGAGPGQPAGRGVGEDRDPVQGPL